MLSPKCPNGWRNNGGCDFAADPSLGADCACVVWLPHIDPTTVVVGPAPDEFIEARSISEVTLPLSRLTANGEHWLLDRGCDALSIALIGGVDTARRVAVVIPLDDSFPAPRRSGRPPVQCPDGPQPRSDAQRPDSAAAPPARIGAPRPRRLA